MLWCNEHKWLLPYVSKTSRWKYKCWHFFVLKELFTRFKRKSFSWLFAMVFCRKLVKYLLVEHIYLIPYVVRYEKQSHHFAEPLQRNIFNQKELCRPQNESIFILLNIFHSVQSSSTAVLLYLAIFLVMYFIRPL